MDDEEMSGCLGDVLASAFIGGTTLNRNDMHAIGGRIQDWLITRFLKAINREAERLSRCKSIEPVELLVLADLLEERGFSEAAVRMRRVVPEEGELLVFQYPAAAGQRVATPEEVSRLIVHAAKIRDDLAKIGRTVVVAVIPDTVSVQGFNVEGRQDAPAQG